MLMPNNCPILFGSQGGVISSSTCLFLPLLILLPHTLPISPFFLFPFPFFFTAAAVAAVAEEEYSLSESMPTSSKFAYNRASYPTNA